MTSKEYAAYLAERKRPGASGGGTAIAKKCAKDDGRIGGVHPAFCKRGR